MEIHAHAHQLLSKKSKQAKTVEKLNAPVLIANADQLVHALKKYQIAALETHAHVAMVENANASNHANATRPSAHHANTEEFRITSHIHMFNC